MVDYARRPAPAVIQPVPQVMVRILPGGLLARRLAEPVFVHAELGDARRERVTAGAQPGDVVAGVPQDPQQVRLPGPDQAAQAAVPGGVRVPASEKGRPAGGADRVLDVGVGEARSPAASRSRLGVRTYRLPNTPTASARNWSATMMRKLGCSGILLLLQVRHRRASRTGTQRPGHVQAPRSRSGGVQAGPATASSTRQVASGMLWSLAGVAHAVRSVPGKFLPSVLRCRTIPLFCLCE